VRFILDTKLFDLVIGSLPDNAVRYFFLSDEQHDLPEWTGAEARGHPQQLERQIPYGLDV
jgi:hypothetical protein